MSAYEILDYYIKKKKKLGYGTCIYVDYRRVVPETLMGKWYKDAREYDRLTAHYDVFADCIENEIYYDREAWLRNRKSNWDRNPQENGSFRKQAHHKKKELSEETKKKREWKKKLKDPRDQDRKGNYYGNSKPYIELGNRKERRNVKQRLNKSDFRYWGKSSTFWDYGFCIGHDYNGECIKEIVEWNPPKDDWDVYSDHPRRQYVNPWDWN